MAAIIKSGEDESKMEVEQSLAVSTPRHMREGLKEAETAKSHLLNSKDMGLPGETGIKGDPQEFARGAVFKGTTVKTERGRKCCTGASEKNGKRLGGREAETMVSGPGREAGNGRLKGEPKRGKVGARGIDTKVINIERGADSRREDGNQAMNGKEKEGGAQHTALRNTLKLRKRGRGRRGNTDTEGARGKEGMEEDTHIPSYAKRG